MKSKSMPTSNGAVTAVSKLFTVITSQRRGITLGVETSLVYMIIVCVATSLSVVEWPYMTNYNVVVRRYISACISLTHPLIKG